MTKHLTLPMALDVVRHSGQTVFKVLLGAVALPDWCVGLCLLKEGLVEKLVCSEDRGKGKLALSVRTLSNPRAKVRQSPGTDAVEVTITPTDLEYVLHFFLKTYRDGLAEVDHLDLQAVAESGEDSYITFVAAEAVPPVSADEARRRLGMN